MDNARPMRWFGVSTIPWVAVVILGVVGCASSSPPETPSAPPPQTTSTVAAPSTTTSSESLAFARYYSAVEARLVGEGLLRTDGGRRDAPFGAATLAANFERIALFNEHTLTGGRFVAQQSPSRLRRWETPVRVQAHFGASVDAAQRAADRAILNTYVTRLARLTGHPISVVNTGGNFHVLYLNRDEQVAAGALVRQILPRVNDATVRAVETMSRSIFCSVYAFSESGARPVYVAAMAIIRHEHPDLIRRSCVHEEIAQGLGLPNDSPAARPSIFNDDDEFALLTPQDEFLLRMLYDARLQIGMTPDTARPTVRRIAAEYLGGGSS